MTQDGAALTDPLVWVDMEMTGLDPDRDAVLEIAVIVTDGTLERVIEGPDLVVHQPAEALAAMAPVVSEMHRRSGLDTAVAASTMTLEQAQDQVLAFLHEHVPEPGTAPLAGNSVHADRLFLRRFLPEVDAHLHYRIVDVSTLKELARRWRPEVLAGAPAKAAGHRALADIRESIDELRHYRDALFRLTA